MSKIKLDGMEAIAYFMGLLKGFTEQDMIDVIKEAREEPIWVLAPFGQAVRVR